MLCCLMQHLHPDVEFHYWKLQIYSTDFYYYCFKYKFFGEVNSFHESKMQERLRCYLNVHTKCDNVKLWLE